MSGNPCELLAPPSVSGASEGPIRGIEDTLIEVTPAPILAWLERLDDRMICCVEVAGGMAIRGLVATPDVTADHAQPEMDPPATDPQAVFAPLSAGRDLLDVRYV